MRRRRRDGWIVIALGLAGLFLAFWLAAPLFDEPGRTAGLFWVILGCLILVGGGIWLTRTAPPRIL
ncbi:MAG TPA: hypothetical protein VGB18_07945 [Candidatus Thermoplasmatota archaeon]